MRKGLQLPLNTIIFLAIAMLVLVAMSGLFFQSYSGEDAKTQKLFGEGCTILRAIHGCNHKKINEISIEGENFGLVCIRSSYLDTAECAKACGCTIPDGESGLDILPSGSSRVRLIPVSRGNE